MIERDTLLSENLESIHTTMSHCHKRLRNRAMLRNLTTLNPVLDNVTRWSSKYKMLRRFNRLRGHLLQVADTEGATVTINRSNSFRLHTERYERMMEAIDKCTLKMQTKGYSLSDCRFVLDTLIEQVQKLKGMPGSCLYGCQLKSDYITKNSTFCSAIVKIQHNETENLSDAEKYAVGCMLMSSEDESAAAVNDDVDISIDSLIEKNKLRRLIQKSNYRNCDFALGSIAEVERLWSIAKNARTVNQKSITPLLFECILFLKINKSYWDIGLVCEAMAKVRSENINRRLMLDSEQEELL